MSRLTTSTLAVSLRRATVVSATALALALTAAGTAQAFGGHGGPGMHGDVAGPQMLERIKGKLNLDTSQQVQFDRVAAHGKAAREAGRADALKMREAMRAELAKAEPDLAAVARAADELQARHLSTRLAVRDEWLKFYATLRAEQKAVVKEALTNRMNRAEGFRHKMGERNMQRGG